MHVQKIIAIVMIAAGALGLAYGGFSYTKGTHTAELGAMHLSIDETQNVNVPVWAGLGVIIIGSLMLVMGSRKS